MNGRYEIKAAKARYSLWENDLDAAIKIAVGIKNMVKQDVVYIFDHQAQAGNIDLWIVSEKGAQPFNKKA